MQSRTAHPTAKQPHLIHKLTIICAKLGIVQVGKHHHPAGPAVCPANSGCAGPFFCGILVLEAARRCGHFFEKHSRKLHSFFLFLLYDILVKKSIIEEGVCIMAKILIVDDEPRIRELIREHLQYSGYICEEAADGTAALTQLSGGAFDLVILDLMMPGEDGLAILKRLRAEKDMTPVIMLTARGEDVDRILGLELGADDYLGKPFNPRELLARIHAVLRRRPRQDAPGAPSMENEVVKFGDFELDLGTRVLKKNGEIVPLTTGEFAVLKAFARHPRQPLSRDKLMEMARGREYEAFDRSLDVQVSRLRKLLEPDPSKPRYLQTVWGLGYVFIPDGHA